MPWRFDLAKPNQTKLNIAKQLLGRGVFQLVNHLAREPVDLRFHEKLLLMTELETSDCSLISSCSNEFFVITFRHPLFAVRSQAWMACLAAGRGGLAKRMCPR